MILYNIKSLICAFSIALICLTTCESLAHVVKPVELKMYVGQTKTFSVSDSGSCSALISVSSSDTSIATVFPAVIDAVSATFTVQASTTESGQIVLLVRWVGEDVGGYGPCQDIGSATVTVDIEDPQGISSVNNINSGESGEPVNTFNGELFFTEPFDLYLDGQIPLYFQRYYASYLARDFVVGDLGDNWLHNYDWQIIWVGNQITLVTEKGKVLKYTRVSADNWTLQTATDTPLPLVQNGSNILLRNPEDNYIYQFNAEGKLDKITDGKGNELVFSYSNMFPDAGKLAEITDNQGRSLVFSYTDAGNIRKLNKVQEKQGDSFFRSVTFSYGDAISDTHLTTVQNARGGFTSYTYEDTSGTADRALLLYKTRPLNNIPVQQSYFDTNAQFDSGKVKTQTDSFNNVTTFSYNGNNATILDPGAATVQHNHDTNGSLTSSTDKKGNVINITNDGSKRRSSVQDPLGHSATFNFDSASGMVDSFTDKNGNTTSYNYSIRTTDGVQFNDLTKITYADGTTENFNYDASGNLVTYIDQADNSWTYTYDQGQATTITNPLGGVTTMVYSPTDRTLASLTDNAGNTSIFAYDSNKRRSTTTFADGATTTSTFNQHNKKTSHTDENGNNRQWTYDDNDNLTRVTDASGSFISHTYDSMDRLVSTTDALGNSSTVTYDNLSRPANFTNRQGFSSTSSYDLTGNITEIVDRAGFSWQATYTDNGKVATTTNPLNETTSYQYDAEGNVTTITSPLNNQTIYSYDSMNRLISQQQPNGELTTFGYDTRGLLNNITLDQSAINSAVTYDALGNVTVITDANGQQWQRSYNAMGLLTQKVDPLGNTTTFQYNNRNRIAKVVYPGTLGTLDILYDATGNLLKRTYSDGLVIDYAYDSNNLRTTALNNTSAHNVNFAYDTRHDLSQSNGLTLTRDNEKRIKTINYTSGKILSYNYDSQGMLTSVQDWDGGTVTFEYDNARRLTKIIRPNGVTTTFTRDAEGYISRKVDGTLSDINISRDANGRISSISRTVPLEPTLSDATISSAFDSASQQNTFSYDAMGRLTDDGNRSYVWNLASQLTSYTENAATMNYSYDAFGLPIARGTRDYIWNYALTTPSVSTIKDNNADSRYYIYTPDGHLLYSVEAADNSRRYYHFDQNGNTLYLTNDAGAMTDSYAYSPYGELLNSTGSFDNPFTYNGRNGVIQQGNTGLYIMRRRFYDASNGYFINREPIDDQIHPRTVNPYLFAANDPINLQDPRGENTESASNNDIVGFGANVGSVFAEGLGVNAQTGSTVSRTSTALGGAATLVGTGVEINRAFDRMDTAENKLRAANQAAWDDFKQKMKELGELYRSKENRRRPEGQRMTWEKYKKIRSALKDALDHTLQVNSDIFTADTIHIATVLLLNGATGWIPGAGLILDWDSVLSDYR